MPPLRAVLHMFLSLVSTLGRRVWGRGPELPAWPLGYEVVVGGLRRNFHWAAGASLARARAFDERLGTAQRIPSGVCVEPGHVGGVSVEIHRPERREDDATTLMYLHGGAHVAGSPRTHRELVARLALAGSCEAVAVEHRLAPEHAIADAVEDALAVHAALLADARRVVWAGDSSGGSLMFLAMVAARARGVPLPERVAAVSPWTDLRCEGASYEEHRGIDWGTREGLRARAVLAARGAPLDDPSVSPSFADLEGMSPCLVVLGEAEILRDSVEAFVKRLEAAGVRVTLARWPGQVHAFPLLAAYHPDGLRAIERIAEFLRAS